MGGTRLSPALRIALLSACLIAEACTGAAPSEDRTFSPAGGTIRIGVFPADGNGGGCGMAVCGAQTNDPQNEPQGLTYELGRCCLLRTLLSYNGRSISEGGSVLRPDLATALPTISADGRRWTFHLKQGIHYAPPLQQTEITSQDFVRSLERLLSDPPPHLPPEYGEVFDSYLADFLRLSEIVVGARAYEDDKADHISGLETPDSHTLVVRLTDPNGGLGYFFALPATAPIPANPYDRSARFGVADGHARFYFDHLVASGPYMIQGAQNLDFSQPPQDQLPATGASPGRLVLVRNPSWDPGTDELRAAEPDRIEITGVADPKEARRLIRRGALDFVFDWDPAPTDVDADSIGAGTRRFVWPRDVETTLEFNLAMPPVDDVHVRRAINYAIARTPIVSAFERAGALGEVASHIGLDSEEDNLLVNFDPYRAATGNLEAAKREMAASRYDHDADGRCDGPACRGIDLIVEETAEPGRVEASRAVAKQVRALGLHVHVDVEPLETFGATFNDPTMKIAMRFLLWTKDLTSGATYFPPLFASERTGLSPGNPFEKIGATRAQLAKWGYTVRSVPNVDGRIESCIGLAFEAQVRCWAELDQYLTTEVVPWAPLVLFTTGRATSPRVRRLNPDPSVFQPAPSLDHVVVRPGEPRSALPEPGPVPDIPEGVYRTRITAADMLRIDPHTEPDDVRENTGEVTIYLRDGRWETVQTATHRLYNPINIGTYTGRGHRVVFSSTAPEVNVISTPPMRWTFDGHELRLKFLSCGKLNTLDPNNTHLCRGISILYEAHPWVKIG